MFSGIVEETAKLVRIEKEQSNIHFYFTCSFGDQLRIDQSVAHNGVCLTVVEIDKPTKTYKVTAMKETLDKSNNKDRGSTIMKRGQDDHVHPYEMTPE